MNIYGCCFYPAMKSDRKFYARRLALWTENEDRLNIKGVVITKWGAYSVPETTLY